MTWSRESEARLMNVARALLTAERPESEFSMRQFTHPCGSPMCALGEYAARTDLQDAFKIQRDNLGTSGYAFWLGEDPFLRAAKHFDLSSCEIRELFDSDGCNRAKTRARVAAYIFAFAWNKRLMEVRRGRMEQG